MCSICSSMYFDEDGDLAHEFYTEQRVQVKSGVVRWVMRKVHASDLISQVHTHTHTHTHTHMHTHTHTHTHMYTHTV